VSRGRGPAALTDEFFQRPSALYDTFAGAGAARRDGRVWVTGHRLCREALADPRLRSGLGEGTHASGANLLFLDGPPHARLRRVVAAAIAAGPTGRAFEAIVARAWDRRMDRLVAPSTADLLADVARPVAGEVIGVLLGFDPDEAASLVPALRAVTAAFEQFEPEAERVAGSRASRELLSVVDERLDELERRSGFVASLGRAAAAGEITDFEALSTTVTFLSAGFENSANFMAGVVLEHLLAGSRPAGPGAAGLEELLRRISATHATVRVAAEALTIGPVAVAGGESVHVVLGAANADPSAFGAGGGGPHLAFGHGPHACVGAGLARTEMGVLVERLAGLAERASLVEPPTWRPRLEFRTMRSLRLRLR